MIVPVVSCARCGGDHPAVDFQELGAAVGVGDELLTHWAPCPQTGEPILLKMVLSDVSCSEAG